LPWSVFYKLSDFLAWVLRTVVRYRKKVIVQNLSNSFPDLEQKEILALAKKSYINLADVLLEGLRGFTMSSEEANKRYVWKNPEVTDKYFHKGKHVIGLASHYGNWEWGTQTIGHQLKHRTLGIVRLLKNPLVNDYLQKTRCAKNVYVADIGETRAAVERFKSEPTLFILISDQGPRNAKKAHWMQFLNQETPCLYGADNLARENNWPVVNISTERIKRGYYELTIEELSEESRLNLPGVITEKYMRRLEQQIIQKPENWLWSHRRWKRAHLKPTE
jgi:KDO2-lipid IV(A) lauroyltransferase